MIHIDAKLDFEDYDLLIEIIHKYSTDIREQAFHSNMTKEQKDWIYSHSDYIRKNIYQVLCDSIKKE